MRARSPAQLVKLRRTIKDGQFDLAVLLCSGHGPISTFRDGVFDYERCR
jgi:hypothetical protein